MGPERKNENFSLVFRARCDFFVFLFLQFFFRLTKDDDNLRNELTCFVKISSLDVVVHPEDRDAVHIYISALQGRAKNRNKKLNFNCKWRCWVNFLPNINSCLLFCSFYQSWVQWSLFECHLIAVDQNFLFIWLDFNEFKILTEVFVGVFLNEDLEITHWTVESSTLNQILSSKLFFS